MRCFFDTSVLVPVFVPGHEHHDRSIAAFSRAEPGTSSCAAHSLAELYATVTRLPGVYRMSAEQAFVCLGAIEQRLTIVALNPNDYRLTIREAASAGIVGGALYDALLGACAMKASVDVLYTWNVRHFSRFSTRWSKLVRTP